MRRSLALALLLALPGVGCASFERSYREFSPTSPVTLTPSVASPEADAVVARFYGPGVVDQPTILAALAHTPHHAALREVAAYDAVLRADDHAAFEHFLAAASDPAAIAPEVYLWAMRSHARTTTEHMHAQALLRVLKDAHPRHSVRQLAAYDLARQAELEAVASGIPREAPGRRWSEEITALFKAIPSKLDPSGALELGEG